MSFNSGTLTIACAALPNALKAVRAARRFSELDAEAGNFRQSPPSRSAGGGRSEQAFQKQGGIRTAMMQKASPEQFCGSLTSRLGRGRAVAPAKKALSQMAAALFHAGERLELETRCSPCRTKEES